LENHFEVHSVPLEAIKSMCLEQDVVAIAAAITETCDALYMAKESHNFHLAILPCMQPYKLLTKHSYT